MNIMISESLFNDLYKYVFTTINFGSRGKGSDTGDYDLLHILPDFHMSCLLPFNNKYLLQYTSYKDNVKHTDHVFITLSQLVHSITNGDNMFIIEIILANLKSKQVYSKILPNHFLQELFFHITKDDLVTFNILRGLLGLAERDLKDIQYKKDLSLNESKKFRFVKESLYFFFMIYNNETKIQDNIKELNVISWNTIFDNYNDFANYKEQYNICIETLRREINYLTKEKKTINADILYTLLLKISNYALINDYNINIELYNIYFKGI